MAMRMGTCALGLLLLQAVAARNILRPHAMHFADLADQRRIIGGRANDVLEDAFVSQGMVALGGIPGFAKLRKEVLRDSHACISVSPKTQSHVFEDGTERRTLAASSVSALGLQPVDHGSDTAACSAFDVSSTAFRKLVGSVVDVFSSWLAFALDPTGAIKLLKTRGGSSYRSLADIVKHGDRLEHFRSYRVPEPGNGSGQTVDFHVDQGLFIAFAPAILVDGSSALRTDSSTGTFMVRSAAGVESEVEFAEDHLIIMAGDGFNQYINSRYPGPPVHAPPHAFSVPTQAAGLHRVWFGLMQLPPADAATVRGGPSFGSLRQRIVEAAVQGRGSADSAAALGCSGGLRARELQAAPTCAANQIYCWHVCANFTADASPEACAAKNLGFNCVDIFGQIYQPKDSHGDYFPNCTNSTSFVTPRPPVAAPSGACSGFQAAVGDTSYSKVLALVPDQTYLLWKVVGDQVLVKMVHNMPVGWMSFGIANASGALNGMLGAHVVIGQNNLDLGITIDTYHIHPTLTAFRHWQTPLRPSNFTNGSLQLTGCFSSIAFQAKAIGPVALNISGGNAIIWALSTAAFPTTQFGGYAPYHSDGKGGAAAKFRGRVLVDFSQGAAVGAAPPTTLVTNAAASVVPCTLLITAVSLGWGALLDVF